MQQKQLDYVVFIGDCLKALKLLETDSVDCVVTSPPYWALRDYRAEGQIGLEKTPQEYVDNIVKVCNELHRVVKPSGSIFFVVGDTFYRGKPREHDAPPYLRDKQKLLIPYRVALALQDNGWVVRNDLLWKKPNPMPESVRDRWSVSSETIIFAVHSVRPTCWKNIRTGEWVWAKPPEKEYYQTDEEGNFVYDENTYWICPKCEEKLELQPVKCYDCGCEFSEEWKTEVKRRRIALWMQFDYFFDLDKIRVPHETAIDRREVQAQEKVDAGRPDIYGEEDEGQRGRRRAHLDLPGAHHHHPLGKNPADTITTQGVEKGETVIGQDGLPRTLLKRKPSWKESKQKYGERGIMTACGGSGGKPRPSLHQFATRHPLGSNPGDVITPPPKPDSKYVGTELESGRIGRPEERKKVQTRLGLRGTEWSTAVGAHPNGKNPGDVLEDSKYKETDQKRVGASRLTERLFQMRRDTEKPSAALTHPKGKNPGDTLPIPLHAPNRGESDTLYWRRKQWESQSKAKEPHPIGRNPGDFMSVTVKPFKGGHYAAYPPDLIRPILIAACPEGGLVLDPFLGSGTTLQVARELGLNGIGIEIQEKYLALVRERLAVHQTDVLHKINFQVVKL